MHAVPHYISWDSFEANQRALSANAQAHGLERRKSPPREGAALLQGLALCGRCGQRMTVRYKTAGRELAPHYLCQGRGIDAAVAERLLDTVGPINLEIALAVEQELQSRLEEADRLRRHQLECARYEAELARRRYLRVDPDNRLVADALEADWNDKLRAQRVAQEDYERQRQADCRVLSERQKSAVRALALDFPRVWNDPKTSQRERKRLLRLLIEDVTLIKAEAISLHIRFKGGATQSLKLPRPMSAWQMRQTDSTVIEAIDSLIDNCTDREIAQRLNDQGLRSGTGGAFHSRIIAKLRQEYGLKSRYQRLRDRGMLTAQEIAKKLDVSVATVKVWRRAGRLKAHASCDKGEYLYEPLGDPLPVKYHWQRSQKKAHLKPIHTGSNPRGAV